jgi:hypothetical protein
MKEKRYLYNYLKQALLLIITIEMRYLEALVEAETLVAAIDSKVVEIALLKETKVAMNNSNYVQN